MGNHVRLLVLSSLLCSGWVGAVQAQENGFIQIKCDPGVQILLDGNLKGVTNSDVGGLILQDIPPGRHEIKAVKPGFKPQSDTLTVEAGRVVLFEVRPFVPAIEIRQEGKEDGTPVALKVGGLKLQSLPIECPLTIPDLVEATTKKKDQWQAKNVPVGEYTITAEALGKRLVHRVQIEEDGLAELFFNLVDGTVKDMGAAKRAEAKRRGSFGPGTPGQTKINPRDGAAMVFIPGGAFQMGSNDRNSDEKPVHSVSVQGFWMYTKEVTNEQYGKFMQTTGHSQPLYWLDSARNQPPQPVVGVTWHDAAAYCKWAGGRLPTEAEWEYAARGGKQLEYGTATGHLTRDLANFDGTGGRDRFDQVAPVGSFPPNPFGVHDMAGNVWEWCSSLDKAYPYRANDGREDPAGGGSRVLRGGSWLSLTEVCRAANRDGSSPDFGGSVIGFRVAQGP